MSQQQDKEALTYEAEQAVIQAQMSLLSKQVEAVQQRIYYMHVTIDNEDWPTASLEAQANAQMIYSAIKFAELVVNTTHNNAFACQAADTISRWKDLHDRAIAQMEKLNTMSGITAQLYELIPADQRTSVLDMVADYVS